MAVRPRDQDIVQILKADGFSVFGHFHSMDETFICVIGTLGDDINKRIFVPMTNVAQITVIGKRHDDDTD